LSFKRKHMQQLNIWDYVLLLLLLLLLWTKNFCFLFFVLFSCTKWNTVFKYKNVVVIVLFSFTKVIWIKEHWFMSNLYLLWILVN
jgi:hypothetical protein